MLFSGGYLAPIGHVLLVSVIRPETAPGKAPKVAKAVAQGLRVRPRRERYWAVAAGAAAGRRGPARRGHSGGEGGRLLGGPRGGQPRRGRHGAPRRGALGPGGFVASGLGELGTWARHPSVCFRPESESDINQWFQIMRPGRLHGMSRGMGLCYKSGRRWCRADGE